MLQVVMQLYVTTVKWLSSLHQIIFFLDSQKIKDFCVFNEWEI